jgi:hypothetical protein
MSKKQKKQVVKEPSVVEGLADAMASEGTESEVISKLSKDLKQMALTMTPDEIRFLVSAYYTSQENRIRTDAQIRELSKNSEPHLVLSWLSENCSTLEKQILRALDVWSKHDPVASWAREVVGVGPVIASGLRAHIDITKAKTAGNIWSFAGLNPLQVWNKGEKRPFNAELKTLCWKLGESFVKVSSHKNDIYGKYYFNRKIEETQKNEKLMFKDQAEAKLKKVKIGKDTDAYKWYIQGKLPPAHIHARAKRYAVKLFLAHFHEAFYWHHYKEAPPLPYPIAFLGHAHVIPAPYLDKIKDKIEIKDKSTKKVIPDFTVPKPSIKEAIAQEDEFD